MITQEQFQYTKEMFQQATNGFQNNFHSICENLTNIWGKSCRASCDIEKHELDTEIDGIPVHVAYRLSFAYAESRTNPCFKIVTSKISAAEIIVPAKYVSYEKTLRYNEHKGYYSSKGYYSNRDKNVHLLIQNIHSVTDILMHSDTYEDFMRNLVLEDAKFPFLKAGEQSYQEHIEKAEENIHTRKDK